MSRNPAREAPPADAPGRATGLRAPARLARRVAPRYAGRDGICNGRLARAGRVAGAGSMSMAPRWRRMRRADLPAVEAIAALLHQGYPERPEVFAERLALAPGFCGVLVAPPGPLLGYAVTHPWSAERGPPALDSLLGGLPGGADAWHVHDIALLPEARGSGLADRLLAALEGRALRAGLRCATLVAVAGKSGHWSRRGFRPAQAPEAALGSYGEGAVFMRRELRPRAGMPGATAAAAMLADSAWERGKEGPPEPVPGTFPA